MLYQRSKYYSCTDTYTMLLEIYVSMLSTEDSNKARIAQMASIALPSSCNEYRLWSKGPHSI